MSGEVSRSCRRDYAALALANIEAANATHDQRRMAECLRQAALDLRAASHYDAASVVRDVRGGRAGPQCLSAVRAFLMVKYHLDEKGVSR